MVADFYNMPQVFRECNSKYFGGELPLPDFDLLRSSNTCGLGYYYTEGHWPDLIPIWELIKSLFS